MHMFDAAAASLLLHLTGCVIHSVPQIPQVSGDLVDAYLARRALDYLLGFGLSPLLWRRLGPAARSAGRLHSYRAQAKQFFIDLARDPVSGLPVPSSTCTTGMTMCCSSSAVRVSTLWLCVCAANQSCGCNAAASELSTQGTLCIC